MTKVKNLQEYVSEENRKMISKRPPKSHENKRREINIIKAPASDVDRKDYLERVEEVVR